MKFDVVLKQFKLNALIVLNSVICINKGNTTSVLIVSKIVDVSKDLYVYETIWFKFGMVTTDSPNCNVSLSDLDLKQGCRCAWN